MTQQLYLAGPFFTAEQKMTLSLLERACDARGVTYYSPRLHGGVVRPDTPPAELQRVFDLNVKRIDDAAAVLAVLDFPLGNRKNLHICYEDLHDGGSVLLPLPGVPPVRLPDVGTVWELGYAYARNVPCVGYTTVETSKTNLMLARGLRGVLTSLDAALAWLPTSAAGEFYWQHVKPHTGDTQ